MGLNAQRSEITDDSALIRLCQTPDWPRTVSRSSVTSSCAADRSEKNASHLCTHLGHHVRTRPDTCLASPYPCLHRTQRRTYKPPPRLGAVNISITRKGFREDRYPRYRP